MIFRDCISTITLHRRCLRRQLPLPPVETEAVNVMDKNKQKEQFNVAYLNALAAQAGINHARTDVDDDSVDIYYIGKGYTGKIRNPQIQLQLKCTSQNLVNGEVIKFPISRKNYDDLRGQNVLCPRYLAVLVVPIECEEWIIHGENSMRLSHSCYWASIRDHPTTTNDESITIDIPLSQRLTATELRNLMLLASNGQSA